MLNNYFRKLVLAIALFILFFCISNFLLVSDSPMNRVLINSYYKYEDNIDILFLGNSHAYCGVNPEIIKKNYGKNAFVLASGAQRWDDTYFLMKDAIANNSIELIAVDLYYYCTLECEENEETVDYINCENNFSRAWDLSYWMRPSFLKYEILYKSANPEYCMETIFPFLRYRESAFNIDYFKENIRTKTSKKYYDNTYSEIKNDGHDQYVVEYRADGYYYNEGKLFDCEKVYQRNVDIDTYNIGNVTKSYIENTIKLAKKNDIPIVFYVAPIYDLQLISVGDYDNYYKQIRAIAEDNNVPFYDFNLMKKNEMDIKHGYCYMDTQHLNCHGADLFTPILYQIITESQNQNERLFFSSYNDKIMSDLFCIYGLYYLKKGEQETEYYIASNRKNVSYTVMKELKNGNRAFVKCDYQNNIVLGNDEHGKLLIEGIVDDESYKITVDY